MTVEERLREWRRYQGYLDGLALADPPLCDQTALTAQDVAVLRGRLRGYLICSRYDTVWHLMNVAVDDRLRRQGIATALLERLFDEADQPGEQYTLEVRPSNREAIALYERFGFRPAGRRRGYYHDNKEDALILWRTVASLEPGAAAV